MMKKEFEIDDILNAVDSIYKIERKKDEDIGSKNDVFPLNNQAKPTKSDLLVLDQMIE